MNRRVFSIIISRVFDFYIVVPLIAILLIYRYNLKFNFLDIFLLIGIPILFFISFVIYESFKKGIKNIDFDLEDGKKTRLISIIFILLWLIFLLGILVYKHYNIYFIYVLFMFILILFFAFLITFIWKISFHAIMITSLLCLSIMIGNRYLMIFFIIVLPFIFYSRYTLKKHTIAQLIGGSLLVFLLFISFLIFHLIVLK